jgi:transposase
MMTKTKRSYTTGFKLEALRLPETSGKSRSQLERDLGIGQGCLCRWKQKFAAEGANAFPGHGRRSPDQERIRQLKREIKVLRQERDILKEAVAIPSASRPEPGKRLTPQRPLKHGLTSPQIRIL